MPQRLGFNILSIGNFEGMAEGEISLKNACLNVFAFFFKITQTGLERLPILRILCSITDTVMPEVAMGMAVDSVD